jgi:NAD(P)-dependent dehydrogenase (short-subunit alcohol dehydrogenase family)
MSRPEPEKPLAEAATPGARPRTGDRPTHGSKNPADGTIRRTVVVLGAASAVGRGAVQAAIGADRRVVAVDADRSELAGLRALYPAPDLITRTARFASDAESARFAAWLRSADRPIDGVIDAMPAGPGRGRVLDRPTDALRDTLATDLLPHLSAARSLIPLLADARRGGSYVLIGGPGSEAAWLNYGGRSIAAAALRMLAGVLHDEAQALDVRVQMLLLETPVRGETCAAHQCPHWLVADAIGERALQLMERDGAGKPAHPVVYYGRHVDSAAARTTSTGRRFTDVRSFLDNLTSADRIEVFPDDNA